MLKFTIKRLLGAIPTLFIIVAVAFFMMRIAPGGPFDSERALTPEIEANMKAAYDLDKPLIVQFGNYLGGVLQGDFGPSFKYNDFTVSELILSGLPVSLTLGSLSLLLALAIGLTVGTIAALKQNSAIDHLVMSFAMTGICIPNFVLAPLLALLFGVYLGWLPVAGWEDGSAVNLILPVTALALPQIAYIARMTRGSMVEVLHSNFIRTAYAKGLPLGAILIRHALPAALLPVVSYLGPVTAGLLTGSVIIEQIFSLPGIGRYFVIGALQRDYTLVMAVVILYASLVIVLNLLADILYRVLDPRVRVNA